MSFATCELLFATNVMREACDGSNNSEYDRAFDEWLFDQLSCRGAEPKIRELEQYSNEECQGLDDHVHIVG